MSHFRSKKLLDSAEGKACMNCGEVGDTVSAHANSVSLGKGTGIKVPDYYTARLCHICHALYDGRLGSMTKQAKEDLWTRAYLRTVAQWFKEGVVKVA